MRNTGRRDVSAPACIAITGLRTPLGQRLATSLLALEKGPRVVGLDLRRPLRLTEGIHFHRLDLTAPTADAQLAECLRAERVEALVHLGFRREPTPDVEADHELDAIGSLNVLNAAAAVGLPRLVVASTTMVYGPSPDNPNYLSEKHPLRGHPDNHWVGDRVEVERLVEGFREENPATEVSVLRGCWVVGPRTRDHVSRFFARDTVPMSLGHDPLMQLLHEDDWLNAFQVATVEGRPGVYNVVGRGVLPLSTLIRLGGKRPLPLPAPLLERLARVASRSRSGDSPSGFLDYIRYLWVAEGERGWAAFGEPLYTTREAWMAFTAGRRLQRFG